MTPFYGLLAALVAVLGIYANTVFEQLLDTRANGRRYLPPQRLVTSRYREMSAAIVLYESIFAEMMDRAA